MAASDVDDGVILRELLRAQYHFQGAVGGAQGVGRTVAFAELRQENAAYAGVIVDAYEETEHTEIVSKYDFYYAPTLYVGEEKIYEAHPGDDDAKIKANVKKALDAALA